MGPFDLEQNQGCFKMIPDSDTFCEYPINETEAVIDFPPNEDQNLGADTAEKSLFVSLIQVFVLDGHLIIIW